ncbi:MAG: T9SS type A sorting domain-containing protein [Flavobacteriales bacterium]|nr:T9SS type A sorting domain-containing protein [Flavobacteriales bacterium]
MKGFHFISIFLVGLCANAQGPYSPAAGEYGSTAVHKDSLVFQAWATHCYSERGWQNCSDTTLGKASSGDSISPVGLPLTNGVISLGDGGQATVSFNGFIYDDIGADFVVFENSFDGLFLELAFVEVSSNGMDFFRFDAVSLTQTGVQLDNSAQMNATNIHNLAGKYKAGYGVPFDLAELSGISGLDISKVTHVRVIDVVGSINPLFGTFDSQNNIINDPFPTPFATCGFDLDAVGVIHFSATSVEKNTNLFTQVYPNPFTDHLVIENKTHEIFSVRITDIFGNVCVEILKTNNTEKINTSLLKSGVYFVTVFNFFESNTLKFIKR